jgi:hypothetical protein
MQFRSVLDALIASLVAAQLARWQRGASKPEALERRSSAFLGIDPQWPSRPRVSKCRNGLCGSCCGSRRLTKCCRTQHQGVSTFIGRESLRSLEEERAYEPSSWCDIRVVFALRSRTDVGANRQSRASVQAQERRHVLPALQEERAGPPSQRDVIAVGGSTRFMSRASFSADLTTLN